MTNFMLVYGFGVSRFHAAIPLRSASQTVNKRIELRTHDEPRSAEHRRGNQKTSKRSYPHAEHTRGTFHRRREPLYTKKRKVSCQNYVPKRSSCNIHAAIRMRFATSRRQHASLYAHRTAPFIHPSSSAAHIVHRPSTSSAMGIAENPSCSAMHIAEHPSPSAMHIAQHHPPFIKCNARRTPPFHIKCNGHRRAPFIQCTSRSTLRQLQCTSHSSLHPPFTWHSTLHPVQCTSHTTLR